MFKLVACHTLATASSALHCKTFSRTTERHPLGRFERRYDCGDTTPSDSSYCVTFSRETTRHPLDRYRRRFDHTESTAASAPLSSHEHLRHRYNEDKRPGSSRHYS